ncbi:MAG: phosphatidate cytidylyltransferase [Bryobacteraceae bacterium]
MKRILTAAVIAPIAVYAVVWANEWIFLAVLASIALCCFHEYSGLLAAYGIRKPGPVGYAAGLVLLLSPRDAALLITLLTLLALVLSLDSEDLRDALPRASGMLLGIVYIFGAWRCSIPLRHVSPYWLLFALLLNWIGDIAAYYAGCAFGKHKLAPRVSPGKSWEGSIASIAASVLFAFLYVPRLLPGTPLVWTLALGAAGNIAGQFGDLAESALKRGAGVKDSGAMLPGHGGWLDRVDSSLFAVPMIYWLVMQFVVAR